MTSKYRILDTLGAGGMATVYRAEDMVLGREVALKVLAPEATDAEGIARFQREAQAAALLAAENPHIAQVYALEEIDGRWCLSMPVYAESARDKLYREGPLAPRVALRLVVQMALALADAHRLGLLHRDVKPENILLDTHGDAFLADFGIARAARPRTTRHTMGDTGFPVGTAEYMAPEQFMASARVEWTADVYSLGVVLYELLTGHVPYDAPTPAGVRERVILGTPIPPSRINPAIWPELEQVILHAMALRPSERFPSAAALASALEATLSEVGLSHVRDVTLLPTIEHHAIVPYEDTLHLPIIPYQPLSRVIEAHYQPRQPWRLYGLFACLLLLVLVLGGFAGATLLLPRHQAAAAAALSTPTAAPSPTISPTPTITTLPTPTPPAPIVIVVPATPLPTSAAPTPTPTLAPPTPTPTPPGTGLKGSYWRNNSLSGTPTLERIDGPLLFNWTTTRPDPLLGASGPYSVRWVGTLVPLITDDYTFLTTSDDGVRLWVNGQQLINHWTRHNAAVDAGLIALSGGTPATIEIDYFEDGYGAAILHVEWQSAHQTREVIPAGLLYPG